MIILDNMLRTLNCVNAHIRFFIRFFLQVLKFLRHVLSKPRETEAVSPEVKDPSSEISEEQIELGISSGTELHTDPVRTDTTTETESSDNDTQSDECNTTTARW